VLVLLWGKLFEGWYLIQSPLLLLSAMLVIIGVQMVLMGLIAELMIRTYYESQKKPIYHIREIATSTTHEHIE
jgi:hypothetical protein